MNTHHAYAIALLPHLRKKKKKYLFNIIADDKVFLSLNAQKLSRIFGRPVKALPSLSHLLLQAEKDITWCEKVGIKLILFNQENYPCLLKEIHNSPFLLFSQGNHSLFLDEVDFFLSIVGTRKGSDFVRKVTQQFSFECSKEGIPIVSGLAQGVDVAAHQGCIEAGGKTIAVLGSGIDRIYPSSHRRVAEEIIEQGGVILSEYPLNSPPLKHHFPQRNRIISGISHATLIMEAPHRSGAMITANLALEQGRDVIVHVSGRLSEGVAKLIDQGAIMISSYEDLRAVINGSFSLLSVGDF